MGSRDTRGSAQAHHKLKMDAIKKKMQAMKVEKDNACDRSDQCEEASKAAKIRAEKAEDEVAELNAKARQLEEDLEKTEMRSCCRPPLSWTRPELPLTTL